LKREMASGRLEEAALRALSVRVEAVGRK